MDINAQHAKQPPLTYHHYGNISHFGQDCPTGFNICLLSQDNHEDLLESLLALKDRHSADASTREMDQQWIRRGFCMQQQVNSMPSLPSHNRYTCLSIDEMSEPSTDEPDCMKAIQEPEPLTNRKLIHLICWECQLPHKYVVASTPSTNSLRPSSDLTYTIWTN
jgi:hypothetical protein